MSELPKNYDPKAIEEKWLQRWLDEKTYHVTPQDGGRLASTCQVVVHVPRHDYLTVEPERSGKRGPSFSSFSPASGFWPERFRWSVIRTRSPGA